jgi:hypothetical protein
MKSATQQEWAAMSEQERDQYWARLRRQDRFDWLLSQWIFPAIKYGLILWAMYFLMVGIETAGPQWLIDLISAMLQRSEYP